MQTRVARFGFVAGGAVAAAACVLAVACGDFGESPSPAAPDGGSDLPEASAPDATTATDDAGPIRRPASAVAYRAAVQQEQPVAYFPLDDPPSVTEAANVAKRSSVDGGARIAGGRPAIERPGLFENASGYFHFDGRVGPRLEAPGVPFLGEGAFTVEAWIRLTKKNVQNRYFVVHSLKGNDRAFGVYVDETDGIVGMTYTSVGRVVVKHADVALGEWHHVVLTNGPALWVDGKSTTAASTPTFDLEQGAGPLYIGGRYDDEELPSFDGAITEVAIYDKALDAAKIRLHYALGRGEGE